MNQHHKMIKHSQTIRQREPSVFDHFWGLTPKVLMLLTSYGFNTVRL